MEILYLLERIESLPSFPQGTDIRWLAPEDYGVFIAHLALCGQNPLPREAWDRAYASGVRYCGLFAEETMAARASVEPLSDRVWEVADARTVQRLRGRGYAGRVCAFVARHILGQGRLASIRTEEDNLPMRAVIARLGFREIGPAEGFDPDAAG